MALLADGWHMGTHAFALGLSLAAYILARKHAGNANFSFGTWKMEILGAFSSALVLGMVGIIMVFTSVERLLHPLPIHYDQALLVAAVGLVVNLACALILNTGSHAHAHTHDHGGHDPHHGHESSDSAHKDLNLRSAYLHVVADALTSVFAIAALLAAKFFGVNWLDPIMGIVGAALIARWAAGLLRDSSRILLDHEEAHSPLSVEILGHIESDGDTQIRDLHLWRVSDTRYACIISLVTSRNYTPDDYGNRLRDVHELAHTTIEVRASLATT